MPPIRVGARTMGKMKMLWAGAKTTEATTDHSIPFHLEFAAYIFQPLTPEFWIV